MALGFGIIVYNNFSFLEMMDITFAAQLWKDNSGRLENKNGGWMYMDDTWILPDETKTKDFPLSMYGQNIEKGGVISNTLGRVLIANFYNKGTHLKLLKHKTILQSRNLLVLRHH